MERQKPERERELPQRGRAPDRPQPIPTQQSGPVPAQTAKKAPWFVASAVAVGLILAGAVAYALQPATSGDSALSEAAKAERVTAFQAHGPLKLPTLSGAEQAKAVDSMDLPAPAQEALEKDLAANKTTVAWITLWDDQVEDGDVVEISGAGFSRVVTLTKQPQQVAIPLASDTRFVVKGMRDGGGGITVAATSEGQAVPFPVMNVGQALEVSILGK